MSVRVVGELAADLRARLPGYLGEVASRYGVPLPVDPLVLDWWQIAVDEVPARFPAVHVRHAGARLGLRRANQGVHDSTHSVAIEFEILTEHREAAAAAMTYAAEAFLLYLDSYPLGSRTPGGLIMKIAPPDGQGIRLTVDDVLARVTQTAGGIVQYRWGMSLTVDLEVRDTTWSTP